MLPTMYGTCSGQEAASTPPPSATAVAWSGSGFNTRWTSGQSGYNAPLYSYNSLLSADIADQSLNVTIDFNGGSGYSAGNTIEQFIITFISDEGSPNVPQFEGDVTGNQSSLDLADLGATMTIPTLSRGEATFDILPLIIANGPDTINKIGWNGNSDRVGTFKTQIKFACLDDAGVSSSFTQAIDESSEIPQIGPTVLQPAITITISTVQGGVSSVGTNSPMTGDTAFTPAIPMTHSGGIPIDDYIMTVAFAFDDDTYLSQDYDGKDNTLGELILRVSPEGGANWEWFDNSPELIVSDFNPDIPLANPPSTTSYNLNTFIGSAIGGLPPQGLIVNPQPNDANTFTLDITTTQTKDIYNQDAEINAQIPISQLLGFP